MAESATSASGKSASASTAIVRYALVIILAVAALYANTLNNPFVFDDEVILDHNPGLRPPWTLRGLLQPPEDSTLAGRPVAHLTFALSYALSGTSPRSYHVANVLLHALTALALLGVLHRTFARIASLAADAAPLAAVVTLCWAAHPLATATVGYVSQRTEALMALCYLGVLYGFIRGVAQGSRWWLGVAVAACATGMAVKEVMVTVPLAVLLYDTVFFAGGVCAALRQRGGFHFVLSSTWLVLALLMSGRLELRGVGYDLGVTWWEYLVTEIPALVLYAKLAVWPHPLVFDYGPLFIREPLAVALPAGLLLVSAAAVIGAWRHRPALGFAAGWFFLVLGPTSSVVPVALQPIAENRAYLATIGLVTLLALGVRTLCGQRGLVALLALAAAGALLTVRRNHDYRSVRHLWEDTVAKRPETPRAQTNYGVVLYRAGDHSAAMMRHALALRLDPRHAPAQNNFGYQALALGRVDLAIAHLQEAVGLTPTLSIAHRNLAAALNLAGRFAEALRHGEIALRAAPLLPEVHFHVGNSLLALGRTTQAIDRYEAELRRQPEHTDANHNLGRALLRLDRFAAACPPLERAVRIDPASAQARADLGFALARVGRLDEATAQLAEALRLDPNNSEARNNLEALRARPVPVSPKR